MEVHRPALWILIAASPLVGVIYTVHAALSGLGLGLAGATLIFLAAALVVRISAFH